MEEYEITDHGSNIANEISEDAYGLGGDLTLADVWQILDQIHTNFMDAGKDNKFLSNWMNELEKIDPKIPNY